MAGRPGSRAYAALMGTCVVLVVLAWNVVRLWSTTAAVLMSVVAAVLPPAAVVVANRGVVDRLGRGRADDEHRPGSARRYRDPRHTDDPGADPGADPEERA